MYDLLKSGQTARTATGGTCMVGRCLGGGSQGEVYACRYDGRDMALKWYHSGSATSAQRNVLEALVAEPSPHPSFLWPEEIVVAEGVPGFGYLMPLRDPRFKDLGRLMGGQYTMRSLALIDACMGLCSAMRALHTRGLSYRDISFNNAFVDPSNGKVLICDNDNVSVNRAAWSGVDGTIMFMAPEVVRGAVPSTASDQHSLAVLLFHMLCMGHPLIGRRALSIKCMDLPAQRALIGEDPVFIFDPSNRSNEAIETRADPSGEAGGTALVYWRLYPQFVRQVFVQAFGPGLRDPMARPTELEWLRVLSRLRDSFFRCECGAGLYFEQPAAGRPVRHLCWSCRREPAAPMRLRIGKRSLVLNCDTVLHAHQIVGDAPGDVPTEPVAAVVRHPVVAGRWGLKNVGKEKWVAKLTDASVKDVTPGLSAPIQSGTQIRFGTFDGTIEA